MPAPGQTRDQDSDRATFPDIERRIGENPARWLDRDLMETGPDHTDRTLRRAVVARIKGIDFVGVANAWIQVERRLGDRALSDEQVREKYDGRDPWSWRQHCPRSGIIELLEHRRDYLIEHGERTILDEDELEIRHERSLERAAEIAAEREANRDDDEEEALSAREKLHRLRTEGPEALAADGGASP